jgi:hypothetical protein
MLKIKNGNIFVTKGQSATVSLKIWNEDGTPFILPFGTGKASLHAYAECAQSDGKYFYSFYNPIKDGTFKFESSGTVSYTTPSGTRTVAGVSVEISEIVTHLMSDTPLVSITFSTSPLEILADSYDATVVVFAVYAGSSNSVVLRKILNMNSYMTTASVTDYSAGGWNKFTKDAVTEVTDYDQVYSALTAAANEGEVIVVKNNDKYYHLSNTKAGMQIGVYNFALVVPLDSSDTDRLESRNYTYDVAVYKGISKELFENDIPNFESGYWKKQLVVPHTFTIGDSQNA